MPNLPQHPRLHVVDLTAADFDRLARIARAATTRKGD